MPSKEQGWHFTQFKCISACRQHHSDSDMGGLISAFSLILRSIFLVREIGLLRRLRKGTLVIKFKERDRT